MMAASQLRPYVIQYTAQYTSVREDVKLYLL